MLAVRTTSNFPLLCPAPQASHLAQLRFIYSEAISLAYAPNRRSSLGGKPEPVLIIDMSGPRSSATLPSSPMQPSPEQTLPGPRQTLPCKTASGGATPNHRMRSNQQSRGQKAGQAETPKHSATTRMPHRMPSASSPANPSQGRLHRQEFSRRLQAWLAEQTSGLAAAPAASQSDPLLPHAGAEAAAEPAADAIVAEAAAAPICSHEDHAVVAGWSKPAESSSAAADGKACQDVDMGIQMGHQDWPDVPQLEMPPVPTPRTMGQFPPPQTPFAMTPMSGGAAATESPAALSTARASASVANARRLSFGGGRCLPTSQPHSLPRPLNVSTAFMAKQLKLFG